MSPLFPDQNETLQPVDATGQPQPTALVEQQVQGRGEEGGGLGRGGSRGDQAPLLLLQAVVLVVIVQVVTELVGNT